ncbi:MAG: Txe/YoeB family addiction module toxin [Cyclobacteriaceae bacterium]|nr:Txe/YoeB family addiction module toxin [Cyclobacteriaceae bacterium]
MVLTFTENAWEDYLYWQKVDIKIVRKINELIKSIQRTPFEGTGNPELLKFDLAGYWSRRIDREHRLVYQVNDIELMIIACRYHYDG